MEAISTFSVASCIAYPKSMLGSEEESTPVKEPNAKMKVVDANILGHKQWIIETAAIKELAKTASIYTVSLCYIMHQLSCAAFSSETDYAILSSLGNFYAVQMQVSWYRQHWKTSRTYCDLSATSTRLCLTVLPGLSVDRKSHRNINAFWSVSLRVMDHSKCEDLLISGIFSEMLAFSRLYKSQTLVLPMKQGESICLGLIFVDYLTRYTFTIMETTRWYRKTT